MTTPEPVSPAPDTEALRQQAVDVIERELDLARSGEGYEANAVAEEIVRRYWPDVAGLRADLDRARAEIERLAGMRALYRQNWQSARDANHQALETIAQLKRELAGARTIPDDAAERAALRMFRVHVYGTLTSERYDASARNQWNNVLDEDDREMWRKLARELLADLGATPTADPAPEPPQSPPNPRPDLPECGATEGGMGVDCHLPAGHTCWHAAHHTPREDGTESIGYPFDIQWPRNEWDHCPPAAPHALAEPTEETAFGALLAAAGDLDGGTDADRRLAEHIRSAVAEVAREDAATPPLPLQDQADLLTWRVVHVPPGTTDREDTDTPITPGWWLVGHGDDPDHPDVQVHLGDRLPTSSAATPAGGSHEVEVTVQDDGWATAECRTCGASIGESAEDTVQDWADRRRADTLRPGSLTPIQPEEA